MNSTKQTLIKIAAILSIIEAIGLIISAVFVAFGFGIIGEINDAIQSVEPGNGAYEPAIVLTKDMLIFLIVIMAIFAILALTGGILLLKSVSDPAKFAEKRGKYVGGAVCTIIAACGFSIAAILLYISFGLKDEAYEPSQKNGEFVEVKPEQTSSMSDEQIKSQMEVLREMKERGEITNEEFKEMMFELIKKS